MTRALRRLGRFLLHVARRFDEVRCLQIASSLTFTTLLALVPLVTIALTLMSAFPVFSGLGEHIHQFLLANMLPEAAGKVVTGYIEQFSGRAGRLTALGTAAIVGLAPFVLACAAFTFLYYVVPNRAVRLRHALLGGFVAALAFEIMKRGFALYIAKFPTYTLVYGAFAVIPIFLLWIYFSWVVIVIGALIAALAPDFAALSDAGSPSRTGIGDVLEVLLILARAQQGPELIELAQIARRASLTGDQAETILQRMVARGWVASSAGVRYEVAGATEKLLMAEVYREFVLDGRGLAGAARSDAVRAFLERFAGRADDALNLPLKRLLESEAA